MFGLNDNNKNTDASMPSGAPPVMPAPMDPNASLGDMSPVMPLPDQQQLMDTVPAVTMPTAQPAPQSMPPAVAAPDPLAVTQPAPPAVENSSVPPPNMLPDQPDMAVPATSSSPDGDDASIDSVINGMAPDFSTPPEEPPQISSNYHDTPLTEPTPAPSTPVDEDELMDIKKQALESLAPLVDELDQTPEEKFKTTMMLIQASDNADLVKDAFAAANQITDEKIRAQALLDVVNEINYFTQAPHSDDSDSA